MLRISEDAVQELIITQCLYTVQCVTVLMTNKATSSPDPPTPQNFVLPFKVRSQIFK
jgi:hypothetical protein